MHDNNKEPIQAPMPPDGCMRLLFVIIGAIIFLWLATRFKGFGVFVLCVIMFFLFILGAPYSYWGFWRW